MTDPHDLVSLRKALIQAARVEVFPEEVALPLPYFDLADSSPAIVARGQEVLRAGKVAIVTMAGGRSTRYGGRFRGDIQVGPVTGRTLFELQGERVGALRLRLAPGLRWLIMVSAATAAPVEAALRRANWFGIGPSDVWIFEQPLLPVVDESFSAARRADGSAIRTPGGHGAMLDALVAAGFLERLSKLDIRYLFVFQYPNVLEHVGDAAMIGWHDTHGHEATAKGVCGVRDGEPVGRLIRTDGRLRVAEYHYLTNAKRKQAVAGCPLWTGTMVWSVSFLEKCVRDGVSLPYHVVGHSEPGEDRSLRRLEQFIFDLLAYSQSTGVVIASRDREFAMLKNISGPDSLERVKAALTASYQQWLTEVGAISVEPVTSLEIGAQFALSAEELAQQLPKGFRYRDGLVLR